MQQPVRPPATHLSMLAGPHPTATSFQTCVIPAQTACARDKLALDPLPNQGRRLMDQPSPVSEAFGYALVPLAEHLNTGSQHMTRTPCVQEEGGPASHPSFLRLGRSLAAHSARNLHLPVAGLGGLTGAFLDTRKRERRQACTSQAALHWQHSAASCHEQPCSCRNAHPLASSLTHVPS